MPAVEALEPVKAWRCMLSLVCCLVFCTIKAASQPSLHSIDAWLRLLNVCDATTVSSSESDTEPADHELIERNDELGATLILQTLINKT
jgi:hypothetical protein